MARAKKTAKKTAKKSKKARSPAQIAAAKRLGAMSKASAAARKAGKKTSKKTRKKRVAKARRGSRSPAQIAAARRLGAMSKARANAQRGGKKRTSTRRPKGYRSKKGWAKWAAAQTPQQTATGQLIYSGPMTRAQDTAARRATRAMGGGKRSARRGAFQGPLPYSAEITAVRTATRATTGKKARSRMYKKLRQDYFKSGGGWENVSLSTLRKASKSRGKGRRPKAAKAGVVTSASIIKGAAKAAKTDKVSRVAGMKAVWVCGNPVPKYTGCGGGKKPHQGARVLGRLL